MKNNNEIRNIINIYKDIPIKNLKIKGLSKNIEDLEKDINNFIGKNKTLKKIKLKDSFLDIEMRRIMKKIKYKKIDNSQVLKSFNNKIEGKNRKFMSDKEIEKFRDKKSILLKMLSLQTEKEKEKSFNKKMDEYKKRRIFFRKLKFNKFSSTTSFFNRNEITFFKSTNSFDNKLIANIPSTNYSISNDNFNSKNKIRLRNQISKAEDRSIIQKYNSLSRIETTKNKYILPLNLFNKKQDSDINLDHIFDNNNNISEDMYQLKRKYLIKNLKVKVNRYENSDNYLPNFKIILKNKVDPYLFMKKKKNMGLFGANNLVKEESNKILNKRMVMKRLYLTSKNELYKTLTPSIRNEYKLISKSKSKDKSEKGNPKIIIKKLNILKKRASKRKKNMVTLYNRNRFAQKVFNFFTFDVDRKMSKSFVKEVRNDALKYKKELGNFSYITGKFLFSKNVS